MNKETKSGVLLDTHIWVWLVNGDKRLRSLRFLNFINEMANASKIFVSIISVWEVAMLEAKGKISLPFSCLEWVHRALRAPGVSLSSLTPEIAVESSRLPGEFHGDPADRILVATAKSLGVWLVTQDDRILTYSKKNPLDVFCP